MTARMRAPFPTNHFILAFNPSNTTQRKREMSFHGSHSLGNVPFSWENKPGVSKVTPSFEEPLKLPPPPCSTDSPKLAVHGLYVPLPPCPFQPPRRISPKKGMSRREDDPFLAAYMECSLRSAQRAQTSCRIAYPLSSPCTMNDTT